MTLKIISPSEILFEGEVQSVTLPGEMGAFTVLKNHASLISSLSKGTISFSRKSAGEGTETERIDVPGGIAVVVDNVISVCVN